MEGAAEHRDDLRDIGVTLTAPLARAEARQLLERQREARRRTSVESRFDALPREARQLWRRLIHGA